MYECGCICMCVYDDRASSSLIYVATIDSLRSSIA